MKKLYILASTLLVIFLTSMMQVEKNDSQPKTSVSLEESQPMFHKGMITIKVKEGIKDLGKQKGNISFSIPSLDSKVSKYEVDLLEKRFKYNPKKSKKGMPDLSRIYRIEFPEEYSVTKVVREFSNDPNIEYAEIIPMVYLQVVPNDTMYGDLHHLEQIVADSAWDIHKGEDGEEEVVIAIVDTGTEWDHEDLVDNIWQNMGEDLDGDGQTLEYIGGEWIFDPDDVNGIDDDGNGFIDDFIGWNFFLSNNNPNPTPELPKYSHGTLCAGLAGATTNNSIGVASISWNLKIMSIDAGLYNYDLGAYDALIYAAENGADIISNSWGYYIYSQAHHEAISYALGLGSILVGGACNEDQSRNFYPASYPGVISVSASNHLDQKASYSNYGPQITICAPGGDNGYPLFTTSVNNSYQAAMGCSMATPITAGLLGLVKSYHPEWTKDQVITQVLASADNIDSNNPGFENQLGTGRINAYRALTDTGVILPQEIALDLIYSDFQDSDNNQFPEPGDTINLSLKLRNYNYGVGAENATFTLLTEDADIILLNDSHIGNIPADDYFLLENVFEFVISEQASTHLVNFELVTTTDKEITWGDTISIELLVAPSGILAFEGEGLGDAYSGDYINEFLVAQGKQVFYTSHFPMSLKGFDAAFLSFGNYGNGAFEYLNSGTPITLEMTQIIAEYLYQGGRIYIECGSFCGFMEFFEYPNREELMELFSIEDAEKPLTANNINLLTGLQGSICEDLVFSGSTQSPNWYIDKMTPNENGVAAFEEDEYGTVAVQGEGEYGQKTFCFAYALAHLIDGDPPNTKDTLLYRIVEFLDLYDPVAGFIADTTFIEEGDTIHFTDLSGNSPISWEWEFEAGTPETSSEQNPAVVYNTPGTYDVTLIVTNNYGSDTITIGDYIVVDPETVINTQNIDQVNIYPNPVKDKLFISHNTKIQSIYILNHSGQIIKKLVNNSNQVEINIAELPNGIYFIRLRIGKEAVTKKIIKMK